MNQHEHTPVFNTAFSDVDAAARPTALVSHQDRVNAQAGIRTYKRETFALLDLSPGDRVLDVGCGAGDDVRALAELVGPTGQVTGVDVSETMVDQARERSAGLGLPVEFQIGDILRLDLPDAAFDGVRADRVLHHLDDPERALTKLVRVARPDGRVVVSEPDFGAFVIDHPDRDVTRRFMTFYAENAARNGYLGRHLYAMFVAQGLVDITATMIHVLLTDLPAAQDFMWMSATLERAQQAGAISSDEASAWIAELETADRAGRFFAAAVGFTVAGRKPRP
jgi:ubiquinone/menaquinone biosynthesis C-methylase UbiE